MGRGVQDASGTNSLLDKVRNVIWVQAWSCPDLVAVADKGCKGSSPFTPALWLFLHRVGLWGDLG